MSDKAKLTQKQVNALVAALDGYQVNEVVREQLIRSHFTGWKIPQYQALNEIDLDTLIRALYIGYEVEQTPEDRIKAMFDEACKEEMDKRNPSYGSWWEGRRMTIIDILNALGIKIEGVNV